MNRSKLTGSRCLCRACGELFNSVRAFEAHRTGVDLSTRRCITAKEMEHRGMGINAAGFWITKPHAIHRVNPTPSQILATSWTTPVGHLGGAL